jgi:hypothetical protein
MITASAATKDRFILAAPPSTWGAELGLGDSPCGPTHLNELQCGVERAMFRGA